MQKNELDLELGKPASAMIPGERVSYTSILLSQGKHRFYTLAMPSDVLASTSVVESADTHPETGFQRRLDKSRAQEIAQYIDSGLGTIPGAIVLSAQKNADLQYNSKSRTLSFKNIRNAFLILDGQHRVYGFLLAKTRVRAPVVIYNNLTKAEEAALFIDINTKQRPVPGELLLAIKRLAETETDTEAYLRNVFNLFEKGPDSALFGLLSSTEKVKGKISRKTFNLALKPILGTFVDSDPEVMYSILNKYLHAWLSGLRAADAAQNIVNTTLLKAIVALFPTVAERVSNKYSDDYTTEKFHETLRPLFERIRKPVLQNPGAGSRDLLESFKSAMQSGFSIALKRQ